MEGPFNTPFRSTRFKAHPSTVKYLSHIPCCQKGAGGGRGEGRGAEVEGKLFIFFLFLHHMVLNRQGKYGAGGKGNLGRGNGGGGPVQGAYTPSPL